MPGRRRQRAWPGGLQITISVETPALGWLVHRGYIPNKFSLQTMPSFFLADTAVRLEVVGQTFVSELRPAWTLLEIEKYFVVDVSNDHGAQIRVDLLRHLQPQQGAVATGTHARWLVQP